MEETTIIGYGVLLAVLLFAACGYYCWSESQKSAMVAEALRVAAERRKGAVAPAEDDGDEEEAAGATAKGWSRVGQQLNWRAAAASVSEPDCTRSSTAAAFCFAASSVPRKRQCDARA